MPRPLPEIDLPPIWSPQLSLVASLAFASFCLGIAVGALCA
jgi:hypothetical protein